MDVGILLWSSTELNIDASEGANMVALHEVEYLNRYGVKTRLFAKSVNKKHPNIGTIRHIEFLESKDYLYYLQFILKSSKSDLFLGINCPKLLFFRPEKTLLSLHINKPWLPYYNIRFFRNRYKKSFYIFCSEFLKNYFLRKYPEISEDRCFVCYNGVDTSSFAPMPKEKDGDKIKILFLGQWIEEKGIYVFLDAIRLLEKRRNDFQVLVGGGPYLWKLGYLRSRQEETERRVNRIIKDLNSIKPIGVIDSKRLPSVYNSADIFVMPSIDQEAFPLVNIEAAACGLPIIASRIGGIPEIVIDGETGTLVEPGDPEALANSIEYLIDNDGVRKRMGKTGREMVEKKFTWDAHTKRLINIFKHVNKHKP